MTPLKSGVILSPMNNPIKKTVDTRVSISPALHRRIKRFVKKRGFKLGAWVEMTLNNHVKDQLAAERAARENQQ